MKPELNYFRLSLRDFLQNSHPHLLDDEEFIAARADLATETCEQALLNGSTSVEAEEQANEVLFAGLHFSKHDTLVNILWDDFSDKVPEDKAKEFAVKLLPKCESIFFGYQLSDSFSYEPEYELLCNELSGEIALYIEKNDI